MIVLLAGMLLAGASTRGGVRECPMSAAHDCCKKAHTPSRSPDMAERQKVRSASLRWGAT